MFTHILWGEFLVHYLHCTCSLNRTLNGLIVFEHFTSFGEEYMSVLSKSEKFEIFASCWYIFALPGINGLTLHFFWGRVYVWGLIMLLGPTVIPLKSFQGYASVWLTSQLYIKKCGLLGTCVLHAIPLDLNHKGPDFLFLFNRNVSGVTLGSTARQRPEIQLAPPQKQGYQIEPVQQPHIITATTVKCSRVGECIV